MIINYDNESPRTLNFGPVLRGYNIKPEFCNEMLQRGLKTNNSHNKNLAGIIEKEYQYSENDRQFFIDNLSDVLTDYRITQNNFFNQVDTDETTPTYKLESLWINIMSNNETNPFHTHDGDLSFVLYVQIDKELIEENKKFIGSSAGPGSIIFQYGEDMSWSSSLHTFFPHVNTMYVFPAKLRHSVAAYKSQANRISISGNFTVLNKCDGLKY